MLPAGPLADMATGANGVNLVVGVLALSGAVYTARNLRRISEWTAQKQLEQRREEARAAAQAARDSRDEADKERVDKGTWAFIAVLQADNAALRADNAALNRRLDELEGRGKAP